MSRRVTNRIFNMIIRGVVKAWKDTTQGFRTLTVELLADSPDDVHHFTIHGVYSTPSEEAPVIALEPSGNPDHLVALVGNQERGPTLASGETAYLNDFGSGLVAKETSIIIGDSAGGHPAAARVGDETTLDAGFLTWLDGVATAAYGGVPPVRPAGTGTITEGSLKVTIE